MSASFEMVFKKVIKVFWGVDYIKVGYERGLNL